MPRPPRKDRPRTPAGPWTETLAWHATLEDGRRMDLVRRTRRHRREWRLRVTDPLAGPGTAAPPVDLCLSAGDLSTLRDGLIAETRHLGARAPDVSFTWQAMRIRFDEIPFRPGTPNIVAVKLLTALDDLRRDDPAVTAILTRAARELIALDGGRAWAAGAEGIAVPGHPADHKDALLAHTDRMLQRLAASASPNLDAFASDLVLEVQHVFEGLEPPLNARTGSHDAAANLVDALTPIFLRDAGALPNEAIRTIVRAPDDARKVLGLALVACGYDPRKARNLFAYQAQRARRGLAPAP